MQQLENHVQIHTSHHSLNNHHKHNILTRLIRIDDQIISVEVYFFFVRRLLKSPGPT